MKSPTPPSATIFDKIVTASLPCFSCDYDLRSLRVDDRCPECGQSIAESIRAAGSWSLRRLRQARIAYAALVVATTAWLVPPLLVWLSESTENARRLFAIAVVIQAISTLTAGVLGCLAGSRRRRAGRLWLVGGIGAVALLPVIGLVWSMLSDVFAVLEWIELFLAIAIVGRGVLVIAAIGALRFAASAMGLPRRVLWTAAAWVIGASALAETVIIASFASDMGNSGESAVIVADMVGAAGIVLACIVGVPLIRAISARLRAVHH